jgi:F-type H+-transporting ATPase subunit delta
LRAVTIALNYAEALFDLAEEAGQFAAYGEWMDGVAGAIASSPKIEAVLMSPRVTKAQKCRILADALPGAPRPFVLFLQAVIKRGRQGLFAEMAHAYLGLVDIKLHRVRAGVTLTRMADQALRKKITDDLTRVIGKEVIASFEEDPSILGGVVVRVGDRIFDGSIRRRMTLLRRQLLAR